MVDPGAARSKQQRARHVASRAGAFGKPPAHLLKFIQDVILKNAGRRHIHAQAVAREILGVVPKNKTHGECRGRHPTGRYGPNGEG
jgi:hypothetical protein